MRRYLSTVAVLAAVVCVALQIVPRARAASETGVFIAAPYVQLGNAPRLSTRESMVVMWHAADTDATWQVQYQPTPEGRWSSTRPPTFRVVRAANLDAHRVYTATLSGLRPGATVAYRVLKDGAQVFDATARVRKSARMPYRVAVVGDIAAGSLGQRRIAYQMHVEKPDFVVVPGDIVYGQGLISQYRTRYFPVYNADEASSEVGAPLTRSIAFMNVLGNHDISGRDLAKYPDGLGYYLYAANPLNGPELAVGAPNTTPVTGPDAARQSFIDGAGPTYPRMAHFSFDYGNSHWTAIDADTYVNWDDPALRTWLENDLKRATDATWKFVVFHQPGFSSSKSHYGEQCMRRLSPLFERCGVDVVWAGHVHNYQRSLPLRFKPDPTSTGYGPVAGEFVLDQAYDGRRVTKANGVVYIVTGAGGASLYDPEQDSKPDTWQSFTARLFSKDYSVSIVDIEGRRMTVRQVADDGRELDRFVMTK